MQFSHFIWITLRQWYILLLFIINRMEVWKTRAWRASVVCFNMMCIQFTRFKKQSFSVLWKMISSANGKVIYFSDGCSGQYKNHKKFPNLSHHYTATMHCMRNGISLQHPMIRMHVMVLMGQLNKWLLMQACTNLSLDKYCHQSLYLSLSILKYLVSNRFGFPLQKSLKTNIFWRKGLRKAVHYQDQDLTTSLGHLQTRGRS